MPPGSLEEINDIKLSDVNLRCDKCVARFCSKPYWLCNTCGKLHTDSYLDKEELEFTDPPEPCDHIIPNAPAYDVRRDPQPILVQPPTPARKRKLASESKPLSKEQIQKLQRDAQITPSPNLLSVPVRNFMGSGKKHPREKIMIPSLSQLNSFVSSKSALKSPIDKHAPSSSKRVLEDSIANYRTNKSSKLDFFTTPSTRGTHLYVNNNLEKNSTSQLTTVSAARAEVSSTTTKLPQKTRQMSEVVAAPVTLALPTKPHYQPASLIACLNNQVSSAPSNQLGPWSKQISRNQRATSRILSKASALIEQQPLDLKRPLFTSTDAGIASKWLRITSDKAVPDAAASSMRIASPHLPVTMEVREKNVDLTQMYMQKGLQLHPLSGIHLPDSTAVDYLQSVNTRSTIPSQNQQLPFSSLIYPWQEHQSNQMPVLEPVLNTLAYQSPRPGTSTLSCSPITPASTNSEVTSPGSFPTLDFKTAQVASAAQFPATDLQDNQLVMNWLAQQLSLIPVTQQHVPQSLLLLTQLQQTKLHQNQQTTLPPLTHQRHVMKLPTVLATRHEASHCTPSQVASQTIITPYAKWPQDWLNKLQKSGQHLPANNHVNSAVYNPLGTYTSFGNNGNHSNHN